MLDLKFLIELYTKIGKRILKINFNKTLNL